MAHITRAIRRLRLVPRTLGVANLGTLLCSKILGLTRCHVGLGVHSVRCRADAADALRCEWDVRGQRHRPRCVRAAFPSSHHPLRRI